METGERFSCSRQQGRSGSELGFEPWSSATRLVLLANFPISALHNPVKERGQVCSTFHFQV